eukprot:Platyproteum_vivax@DN7010_c0_g2_i1.p2
MATPTRPKPKSMGLNAQFSESPKRPDSFGHHSRYASSTDRTTASGHSRDKSSADFRNEERHNSGHKTERSPSFTKSTNPQRPNVRASFGGFSSSHYSEGSGNNDARKTFREGFPREAT